MFLLFAGSDYYPSGGWEDFKGKYDSLEEATVAGVLLADSWVQIVDLNTLEVVWQSTFDYVTRKKVIWSEG